MLFGVLGPLELYGSDGKRRELPAAKERLVAAALLARPNSVVGVEALIRALWDENPPRTAAKTLQTYVSSVRRAVGADRVRTQAPGYRFDVADDELDSLRFARLADEGRRHLTAGSPAAASSVFAEALRLWRGEPFADFPDHPTFVSEVTRLRELRWSVIEADVDARLGLSQHGVLVAELEAHLGEQPFRERLWEQLAVALYRSGRQADAVGSLQRARHVLVELHGLEPGAELRRLEDAILRQDPALAAGRHAPIDAPVVEQPLTRYVRVGEATLAYQTVGEGSDEVLLLPDWFSHLECIWEHPAPRRMLSALATGRRLVLFDGRGTGLSDPVDRNEAHCLDDWMNEARAVLDTAGCRRVVIFAASVGAMMAVRLAAHHPERVRALVLVNPAPSLDGTLVGAAGFDEALRRMTAVWGAGPGFTQVLPHTRARVEFATWFGRYQRLSLSPGQLERRLRMFWHADATDVAHLVDAPTLVLHRRDNPVVPTALGRMLADRIAGGRFEELDGDDHFWAAGDVETLLERTEAFLDTV